MDTSDQYIEMCEKSVELHKESFDYGDVIYEKDKDCVYTIGLNTELDYYDNTDNKIQLFRQDQLQRMYDDRPLTCYFYFEDFIEDSVLNDNFEPISDYENWSLEQLWLAFVMKEKFNKTWNGKEWII